MTKTAASGRRGPKRTLSEELLLDAALALLDAGGPGAASVRAIAARVGVAPNAVYTYFPDKAALEKAMVERMYGCSHKPVLTSSGVADRACYMLVTRVTSPRASATPSAACVAACPGREARIEPTGGPP